MKLGMRYLVSFLLGAVSCTAITLISSRSASGLWAVNSQVQMAAQFENDARISYMQGNKAHARDLMRAALLIRRQVAQEEYPLHWKTGFPIAPGLAQSLNILDFYPILRKEGSGLAQLHPACAVLALTDQEEEFNALFGYIRQMHPKLTRDRCIEIGLAQLK